MHITSKLIREKKQFFNQRLYINKRDNNYKEYWGLMRFMLPYGSDTHASHMTVNMFTVYDQVFMERKPGPELTESQKEAIQKGLETRDYKKVYHGTLIRKVR